MRRLDPCSCADCPYADANACDDDCCSGTRARTLAWMTASTSNCLTPWCRMHRLLSGMAGPTSGDANELRVGSSRHTLVRLARRMSLPTYSRPLPRGNCYIAGYCPCTRSRNPSHGRGFRGRVGVTAGSTGRWHRRTRGWNWGIRRTSSAAHITIRAVRISHRAAAVILVDCCSWRRSSLAPRWTGMGPPIRNTVLCVGGSDDYVDGTHCETL